MGYIQTMPIWDIFRKGLYGIYSEDAYLGYIQERPIWDILRRGLYMGYIKERPIYGMYLVEAYREIFRKGLNGIYAGKAFMGKAYQRYMRRRMGLYILVIACNGLIY